MPGRGGKRKNEKKNAKGKIHDEEQVRAHAQRTAQTVHTLWLKTKNTNNFLANLKIKFAFSDRFWASKEIQYPLKMLEALQKSKSPKKNLIQEAKLECLKQIYKTIFREKLKSTN